MTGGLRLYLLGGALLLGLYGAGGYHGWWHAKPHPPGTYGSGGDGTGGYGGGHGGGFGGGFGGGGGGFRGGK
jgi:hypothetical protein